MFSTHYEVRHRRFTILALLVGFTLVVTLLSALPVRAQNVAEVIVQSGKLVADDRMKDDNLGHAIAVSGDILLAGAPHILADNVAEDGRSMGAAYLFARNQGGADLWGQIAKLSANDAALGDHFGESVAISGTTVVVAASDADVNGKVDQGAVYIFARNQANPNQWDQVQKLTSADGIAGDHFGRALALDGDTLLVGSLEKAYLFTRTGASAGTWSPIKTLLSPAPTADQRFGDDVALQGDLALVGADGTPMGGESYVGAAYLFARNQGGSNQWGLQKTLQATAGRIFDFLGASVALHGDQAFVAAPGRRVGSNSFAGLLYVFDRNQGGANQWGELQQLTSDFANGANNLGQALTVGGNRLVAGAGVSAYLYEPNPTVAGNWQLAKRAQSTENSLGGDNFLAAHERWIFGGSPSAGSPPDNFWQGAIYLFDVSAPAAPEIRFSQPSYGVEEGVGTAVITVTLDRPSPIANLTVDYSTSPGFGAEAMPNLDYAHVTGTLTFAQGASVALINIPITNDTYPERDETFFIGLFNERGGVIREFDRRSAQVTIAANDASTPCNFIANDEASLNLAINCVNVAGAGSHTISVTADISFTQRSTILSNPAATQITLAGNDHRLDAQGHGRVLTLYLSNLLVRNLTLSGGRLSLDLDNNERGGAINLIGSHGAGTCGLTIENSVLEDNEALIGGAIHNGCDGSLLTINNSILRNNRAAWVGGAIMIPTGEELFSELVINKSIITGNRAQQRGGGIYLDGGDAGTNVTINDSTISDNVAVEDDGGGLRVETGEAAITNLTINRSTFSGNTAQNGAGLQISSQGSTNVTLANVTVSGNRAISQTGGGLWVQGVSEFDGTHVLLINSTVASNTAASGGGIYQLDGMLVLSNTLVAGNLSGGDCSINTSPGLTSEYRSGGNNLDGDGSCLPAGVRQPGDIANGVANLGALADNGGGMLTQALLPGSQAIDAGNNATCLAAPVNATDQRGEVRPQGERCDIGAFETMGAPPPVQKLILVSSSSGGKLGDLGFRDEDILAFDPSTNGWSMVFDGSDVGVTKDVDAFTLRAGKLLLSFNGSVEVPGVGLVDDSDIVEFTPITLGLQTAGSFALYFDGSAFGLDEDEEDIDALTFDGAGNLIISTNGDFDAGDVDGEDEDLFVKNGAGWLPFFDGSDVALTTGNEDIKDAWFDAATQELYLVTKGNYQVAGLSGDKDDIFICQAGAFGENTACTFRLFWDGDLHGYGGKAIDGIFVGSLPSLAVAAVDHASNDRREEIEEEDVDDEPEEVAGETVERRVFLPLVGR